MRPLRLVVDGFTSFRDPQEIDLTGLTLFCITGPTGSGKTSLFDAMAFALYGRVPRVANRVSQMVATGRAEARVQLDFACNGDTYRVTRRLAAGGGHRALLEALAADGATRPLADGATQVAQEAARITGLDFPTFTRAVMLPQGRFAEFLSGDASERRAILARLLDLGRYEDAGRRARARADGLRREESTLRRTLDGQFADAVPAVLREAEAAAAGAARRAEVVARALDEVRECAARERAALEEARALDAAASALSRAGDELAGAVRALAATAPRRAASQAELHRARSAFGSADAGWAAAAEAAAAVVAGTGDEQAVAALDEALGRWASAGAGLADLQDDLADALAARELAAGRSAEADAAASAAAKALAAAEESARLAQEARSAAAGDLDRARRLAGERAAASAAAADSLRAGEAAAAAEGALRGAHDDRARAEQAVEALRRCDAAGALRRHLVSGEPCPVCEQVLDGPAPAAPEHLDREIASAEAVLAAARRAGEAASAAAEEARQAVAVGEARRAAAAEREAAIAPAPGLDDAQAALDAAAAACEQASGAVAGAREVREARGAAARDAAEQHRRASQHASALEERGRTLRVQRTEAERLLEEVLGAPLPADPARAVAGRRDRLAAARSAELAARAAREDARRALDGAQAVHQGLMEEERSARAVAAAAAGGGRLADERLHDLAPGLGMLLLWPLEPGDLGPELPDAVAARAAAAAATAAGLREDAAAQRERMARGAAGAGVPVAVGGDVVTALEAAVRTAVADAATAGAGVEALRARMASRAAIEAQMEECVAEAAGLEWLGLHLRSDRFIDFLLQENLDAICLRASDRLREMSGDRYTLDLADEGEGGGFRVVDHHNAGERRAVATLSGGETFQASLALALALAEGLADLGGAGGLEAVFVDEGFAALDAETLDLAIGALESVQAGGDRVVGVITHLAQMAERIPEGLDVRKGVSGSTVVRRGTVEALAPG